MPIARTLFFPLSRTRAKASWRQLAAKAWRMLETRHGLAELDERMLKDLGISRAQAQFELRRPFWKLFD
jgi:uncharacterized protein YjiS (DUF1127 family)